MRDKQIPLSSTFNFKNDLIPSRNNNLVSHELTTLKYFRTQQKLIRIDIEIGESLSSLQLVRIKRRCTLFLPHLAYSRRHHACYEVCLSVQHIGSQNASTFNCLYITTNWLALCLLRVVPSLADSRRLICPDRRLWLLSLTLPRGVQYDVADQRTPVTAGLTASKFLLSWHSSF